MSVEPAEPARRRRRSVEDARREILAAAEKLLDERGPEAVRVQTVARAVGLTDAAVHYHFGNREGLLEALLRDVGRRMKAELAEADDEDVDLGRLLDVLDEAYRTHGYARLTAWMRLAGWRPTGEGMFRPYAEALHRARIRRAEAAGTPPPPLEDTLHLVTLLNLVSWADALTGAEWRRSVGLPATAEAGAAFRQWLLDRLGDRPGERH